MYKTFKIFLALRTIGDDINVMLAAASINFKANDQHLEKEVFYRQNLQIKEVLFLY